MHSVTKLSEPLTVSLLIVNDSKTGSKNFENLYVCTTVRICGSPDGCLCKADKVSLKGEQPSTHLS